MNCTSCSYLLKVLAIFFRATSQNMQFEFKCQGSQEQFSSLVFVHAKNVYLLQVYFGALQCKRRFAHPQNEIQSMHFICWTLYTKTVTLALVLVSASTTKLNETKTTFLQPDFYLSLSFQRMEERKLLLSKRQSRSAALKNLANMPKMNDDTLSGFQLIISK